MEKQNITLSLSKDLLQKVKLVAVKRHTSVSGLVTEALEQVVEREDGYEQAKRRALDKLANPPNLGTGGERTWTRDELHERH